jgi:hypothetical protein
MPRSFNTSKAAARMRCFISPLRSSCVRRALGRGVAGIMAGAVSSTWRAARISGFMATISASCCRR